MITCDFVSCHNPPRTKGYCNGHYQQIWKGQELRPLQKVGEVPCSFHECVNPSSVRGLCGSHRKQERKGQVLKPLRPRKTPARPLRKAPEREAKVCGARGCQNMAEWDNLLCAKHRRHAWTFSMSAEAYIALETSCSVCGTDGEMHIDHDHACCPTKKSCGRCVRGVLCRGCNFALGNVNDDPHILRGLIEYLQRNNSFAN